MASFRAAGQRRHGDRDALCTFRQNDMVLHVFDENVAMRMFREMKSGCPLPHITKVADAEQCKPCPEHFDIFSTQSLPSDDEQTGSSAKGESKGKGKAKNANAESTNNGDHSKHSHVTSNTEPRRDSQKGHASANTKAAGKGVPPGIFWRDTAGRKRYTPWAHTRDCSHCGAPPGPQPLPAALGCSVPSCRSISATSLPWDPFETGDNLDDVP